MNKSLGLKSATTVKPVSELAPARMLPEPHGKVSDLPVRREAQFLELGWVCPKDGAHSLIGSAKQIYCRKCNRYWNRHKL